jgi:hypothetical protein
LIYDTNGNPWLVVGADPASKVISKLKRKHYDYITLPISLLATGVYTGGEPAEIEDIIARVRYLDCLEELS